MFIKPTEEELKKDRAQIRRTLSDAFGPVRRTGEMQYGLHFEAVAWYKGLNVWRVIPWPEREVRPIHSTLIGTDAFTIENDAITEIDVVVREKELYVDIDGHYITVPHDEIPETFHVGITACEGFNRFYEFSIEE